MSTLQTTILKHPDSSLNNIQFDNDGRVGVQTSTPEHHLHVNSVGTFVRLGLTNFSSGSSDSDGCELKLHFLDFSINNKESGAINFLTADQSRMRIGSDGYVGINTSTPQARLAVQSGSLIDGSILVGANYNGTGMNQNSDKLGAISFPMYQSDTYPKGFRGLMSYSSSSVNFVQIGGGTNSARSATSILFYTAPDIASNGKERMKIDQNGTMSMGDHNTNGGFAAFVADPDTAHQRGRFLVRAKSTTGGLQEIFQLFTGTTAKVLLRADGNLYNAAGGIGVLSDIKLKENIVSANSQWDDIKGIQIRNFNFKEETGHETHTMLGVVAQEVETVSPGLVTDQPDRDENGNDLGTTTKLVNSSILYMKAVKALQEAMARIEELEAKVAALEAG